MTNIVEDSSMNKHLASFLSKYRYPLDIILLIASTLVSFLASETTNSPLVFYPMIGFVWVAFVLRPCFLWYFEDSQMLHKRTDNNLKERTWVNLVEKGDIEDLSAAIAFGYDINQRLRLVRLSLSLSLSPSLLLPGVSGSLQTQETDRGRHYTALAYSCENGNVESFIFLWEHPKTNKTLGSSKEVMVHFAVKGQNEEILSLLLDSDEYEANSIMDGCTPLMLAGRQGWERLFHFLWNRKEINRFAAPKEWGASLILKELLLDVARAGSVEMMEELYEYPTGPPPQIRSPKGGELTLIEAKTDEEIEEPWERYSHVKQFWEFTDNERNNILFLAGARNSSISASLFEFTLRECGANELKTILKHQNRKNQSLEDVLSAVNKRMFRFFQSGILEPFLKDEMRVRTFELVEGGNLKGLKSLGIVHKTWRDLRGNNLIMASARGGRENITKYLFSLGIFNLSTKNHRRETLQEIGLKVFKGRGKWQEIQNEGPEKKLFQFIEENNLKGVQKIFELHRYDENWWKNLSSKVDNRQGKVPGASKRYEYGDNALMAAVRLKRIEILEYLLSLNIFNFEMKNKEGETAKDIALRELGEKWYDLQVMVGSPPLAASKGSIKGIPSMGLPGNKLSVVGSEDASLFFEAGESEKKAAEELIDGNKLFLYVEMGWFEGIMEEFEKIRDDKHTLRSIASLTDEGGNNLLMVATRKKLKDIIRYLLEFRIFDMSLRNNRGETVEDIGKHTFGDELWKELMSNPSPFIKKGEKEGKKNVEKDWLSSMAEKFERHKNDDLWKAQCASWVDKKGNNLLMNAVLLGRKKIIKYLIGLELFNLGLKNKEGKNVHKIGEETYGKVSWQILLEDVKKEKGQGIAW